MRYAFDPELAAAVAMMPEVDIGDVAAARAAQAEQLSAAVTAADTTGVVVEDVSVPGPEGAPDLPLRLYRPRDAWGPLPVLYAIHGGGFVVGTPDADHEGNLRFCRELGALVVSPDYRLAPEHPFPAGLDDCYAGLVWLAKNSAELGILPDRTALWGDSAGACLAAALTLLAHDRGGPDIRFQCLAAPALDDRLRTASAQLYTDTPVWNRRNAQLSWEAYLGPGTPGSEDVSPYAAPARAGITRLAGLPPAHITVMQFDPLRDEGIDYARSLLAAGVPTELHVLPGTFHGATAVEHAAVIRRITAEVTAVLGRALA